ncbi:TPA: hypothetical protein N0F65_013015 [Lagenidium giganteum]|uniref:Uncharacterized protein n=1 Tax=Lagenidium giganteum TaxID=4803 RepID=A0AAV2YMS3_9STRA|nr:TPA: hypothetical protein N0F65_013015 [Lagenidium giganteum]
MQVFSSSYLIGRVWINYLYVAVLLCNCMSTWTVAHFFRSNESPALDRVMCLVIDVLLDACMCIVSPSLLFAPYYRAYDANIFLFDLQLLFDDVWFVNLIRETRKCFVQCAPMIFEKRMFHA